MWKVAGFLYYVLTLKAVEKIPLHMKAIISGILKDYEGLTLEDRIELIDHSEDIIY